MDPKYYVEKILDVFKPLIVALSVCTIIATTVFIFPHIKSCYDKSTTNKYRVDVHRIKLPVTENTIISYELEGKEFVDYSVEDSGDGVNVILYFK